MTSTTRTVLLAIGLAVLVAGGLVVTVLPIETAGQKCGTALSADYSDLELAQKIGAVAAKSGGDIGEAGARQANAAVAVMDDCDTRRTTVGVAGGAVAAIGAGLVVASLVLGRRREATT